MADTFRIYKNDEVVVEGVSPLTITGIEAGTDVADGAYQAVRLDGDEESERVDIPAFSTLAIEVESVSLSPKTSAAEAGKAGSRKLTATVKPDNATNQDVVFSVSPEADGLEVDGSGNISWTDQVAAGSYETTVTTSGHTDTHVLTLTEPE